MIKSTTKEVLVMGILNCTPDSFYDGGVLTDAAALQKQVAKMVSHQVNIIDVGGQSTRPGAILVDEEVEMARVIPVIKFIKEKYPQLTISVDTFRAEVAKSAAAAGANIINDISAGSMDPKLLGVVAELQVPYVLMHMQGKPSTMQENPVYSDIVQEVYDFFSKKIQELEAIGIKEIIIDPGFGFGKTVDHNYTLLKHLKTFKTLGKPILVGFSRKSMITKVLKNKAEQALNGTTVLNTIAMQQGANILRVHDVQEAVEAVTLYKQFQEI